MDNTLLAEHVEAMADLIEKCGHKTQDPGSPEDGFCLLGAGRIAFGMPHARNVYAALHERMTYWSAIDDIDKITAEALGIDTSTDVWQLNDGRNGKPPLNKTTALELLDKRAKELRNNG